MSADDFLHITGWGDFSADGDFIVNVDNAIVKTKLVIKPMEDFDMEGTTRPQGPDVREKRTSNPCAAQPRVPWTRRGCQLGLGIQNTDKKIVLQIVLNDTTSRRHRDDLPRGGLSRELNTILKSYF